MTSFIRVPLLPEKGDAGSTGRQGSSRSGFNSRPRGQIHEKGVNVQYHGCLPSVTMNHTRESSQQAVGNSSAKGESGEAPESFRPGQGDRFISIRGRKDAGPARGRRAPPQGKGKTGVTSAHSGIFSNLKRRRTSSARAPSGSSFRKILKKALAIAGSLRPTYKIPRL